MSEDETQTNTYILNKYEYKLKSIISFHEVNSILACEIIEFFQDRGIMYSHIQITISNK